jgi:hypothetical protein
MIGLKVIFIIGKNLLKYAMYHLKCALLYLEYHKVLFLDPVVKVSRNAPKRRSGAPKYCHNAFRGPN